MDRPPEDLPLALASVERHRGVLAFCMGHYQVALESFIWALERERSAENLANVLASLLRLDDLSAAQALLDRARVGLPPELTAELERQLVVDADLAGLR